jgi:glycosyltransferase involved in cell wall biosynthesis
VSDLPISTIIPTYNRAPLLSRAISSALLQLNEDDELIVIDDGSTDDTERLVARYGDRVRYVKTPNRGAGAARNRGIREARNPLVAFLDSDDEWMPGKIKLQRAFMGERPDILFSFANQAFRRRDGRERRFSMQTWPGVNQSWEEIFGPGWLFSSILPLPKGVDDFLFYDGNIYLPMLTGIYVNANTIMVRRKDAGDALHFAENTKTYEDWECFGRLAGAGNCAYLDCEMAWQNMHYGSRLTDFGGFERSEARVTIIERVWGSDEKFLKAHSEFYQKVLYKERISKVVGLIKRGQTIDARKEINKLAKCPLPHRILAGLPGWVAKPVVKVLHSLRHGFK